jgi:hypothetical protein
MTVTTDGESLQELNERLRRLERDSAAKDAPRMSPGEFLAMKQIEDVRRRLERAERARVEHDARREAQEKRQKRREKLEAELHRLHDERQARLVQHERAHQRLIEQFQRPVREAEEALAAVDAEVEADVALASKAPISVAVPKAPPPGIDRGVLASPGRSARELHETDVFRRVSGRRR